MTDSITLHCEPLIRWLTEKIERDHGMQVLMSLEKEFHWNLRADGDLHPDDNSIGAEIEKKRIFQESERCKKLRRPRRPTIESIHHDIFNPNYTQDTGKFEVKTKPASPIRVVRRMNGAVNALANGAFQDTFIGKRDGFEMCRPEFKPFREHIITTATLEDGSQVELPGSYGLHVNFSLWKNGDNLMHNIDNVLEGQIYSAFKSILEKDLGLICPSESSFTRLTHDTLARRIGTPNLKTPVGLLVHPKKNYHVPQHTIYHQKTDAHTTARMEFRVPDAESRHDLSALFVLVSLYDALTRVHQGVQVMKDIQKISCDLPHTAEEAHERVQERSRVFSLLSSMAGENSTIKKHVFALRKAVSEALSAGTLQQPVVTTENSATR